MKYVDAARAELTKQLNEAEALEVNLKAGRDRAYDMWDSANKEAMALKVALRKLNEYSPEPPKPAEPEDELPYHD
ncbi:hypothetical protein SEA_DUMPTRUCK_86 [Gordonia phage DumpTruck]|nr:hypothetical protein SEA_DUMPTRUCK_86 [Gordonia phage DumpTruck]